MGLDPDAAFRTAIAEGTVKVAELYIITLTNGSVFRYTSHGEDIEWGPTNELYTAIPLTRDAISSKISLEADAVSISLQNITGDLFDEVQKNVLDSADVVIKRILWNESYAAGMELLIFRGTADIEFDRQILTLNCRSILDTLNIQVPKDIFQEPCNKRLYDAGCTLIRTDFDYAGTATGGTDTTLIDTTRGTVYKGTFDAAVDDIAIGETITGGINSYTAVVVQVVYLTASTGFIFYVELSNAANFEDDEVLSSAGDSVTLNGVPVADPDFYAQGELEMLTGDNAGQRRPILKDSASTTTVIWAFPNDVAAGDTYKLYPGCDKQSITCTNKFDNDDNFRGFKYIPRVEEVIM